MWLPVSRSRSLIILLLLAAIGQSAEIELPVKLELRAPLHSRSANIHLSLSDESVYPFTVTYGACDIVKDDIETHHISEVQHRDIDRLVWVLPDDIRSHGCLSAWSSQNELLGRSLGLKVNKNTRQWLKKRHLEMGTRLGKRASIPMTNASGIEANGPWFDGVEALRGRETNAVDAAQAKAKHVAIVGAGMAGLITWLCLNMSGFQNLEIVEAGQRLGGRVHTAYLEGGPFDYQYQDVGPMRFPESVQYTGSNETTPINDQQLVFQLGEIMNQMNEGRPNYTVNFIPWIQESPNGLYYFSGLKDTDGLPPTAKEVKNNPKLTVPVPADPIVGNITDIISEISCNPESMAAVAKNVFSAYKTFINSGLGGLGGDDWSEFAYLHNQLGYSLDATDRVVNSGDFGGYGGNSLWEFVYSCAYFGATTWRTIDGGLSQLPNSFYPHVGPITTMGRSIERAQFLPETNQVQLSWKDNYTDVAFRNKTYDYAIIAVPFSKVRSWRFPNTTFNPTLKNAITAMPYDTVCKVALQFSSRFWEHYPEPIYGGCSTATDIPGIGSICYPSYKINSTGPGVMLASYTSGDFGIRFASLPELEHVQYVLNAMIEIHGEVAREQYTGRYHRKCWALDPLESASWATPSIGMHKLYIPTYFETHNNMIFVGEHTSYTHAWISSALESGIRGSVQLLLELGLVDEAKAITEKFMARWISV
ncbi:MAG: hypothetical protein L6R38_007826 [Xanthoria sp. 2 TBL-2021]|nr:MAG: hypothetical protein L6R38_007826 [Xanthoria sp. 2 TBL-2021]